MPVTYMVAARDKESKESMSIDFYKFTVGSTPHKIEGDFGAKKIIADNEKKVFKLSIQDKGVITDFNNINDFETK